MGRRLEGKTAIVTGGASGIGRATCLRFAAEGASVTVADKNIEQGQQTVSSCFSNAEFMELDVTKVENWESVVRKTLSRFGAVNVLINAAGILIENNIENATLEEWHSTMAVNVLGTYLGCRTVASAMRRSGSGSIVNIGSVCAFHGSPDAVSYDTSKGAVRSMTKELSIYFARNGDPIRCNAVHPGVVDTSMVKNFFNGRKEKEAEWRATQPHGRFAKPDQIASMLLFLASEEASFMTGGDYLVDGGALV